MKKLTVLLVAFACVGILMFSTCKKENSMSGMYSQAAVRLKDDSGHWDHVWLHLRGFRLRTLRHGVITFPINDTLVDILQLKDSSILLGIVNIPADTITEISLMIGGEDSVTVDGISYVLSVESGDSDDVALQIRELASPGKTITLLIDLDAAQSIFADDHHHGWFYLNPLLHEFCKRKG